EPATPAESGEGEAPVVDDPNRFGAIPIISADEPPRDPTPPRGVPVGDAGDDRPAAATPPPAPEPEPPRPEPVPAAPDLDDLDLPPTAAVPTVGDEPADPVEPRPAPEPAATPEPAPAAPRPEPAPAASEEDLDDIRV